MAPVDRRGMNMMAVKLVAPQPRHAVEQTLNLELAHIERSRFVEKCAEADRHLLRMLQLAGKTVPPRAPFSQKVDALRPLLTNLHPTIRQTTMTRRLARLESLWALRSELAHSTMSIADVEGERVLVLRNATEQGGANGGRTILTLQSLKDTYEELSSVANSLKQAAQRLAESGFPLSRE